MSITSNALDLYSPKFGLDGLGKGGEKIIIRVVVSMNDKSIRLFGSYEIGSRHAQISADVLGILGDMVTISSVSRYAFQDAVSEINAFFEKQFQTWGLTLFLAGNNLIVRLQSRKFPAIVKRVYTSGGRLNVVLQLLGKLIKIVLTNEEIKIFDSSRREIVGLVAVGKRLALKRKFQHPELDAEFSAQT